MKIKKFIFLIIFILLFIACSENKENDLSKEGLNGQVKSIQEMTFICSDKYGEIIKERVREVRDYKEFNKSGNLTKYISLSLSVFDMTDTIFYLYNEKK